MAAVVSVVAIVPSAGVAAPIPANFFTVVDQEGVNDVNSDQVDMTQMGRDDSDQTMYRLFWSWDSTDMWYGTGQTGDACALFDSDGDGNVNYAVCARIENVPKQDPGDPDVVHMVSGSPMLFTCSDATNDRCSQPTGPLLVQGITAGTLGSGGLDATGDLITDTDPFSPDGSNYPDDSTLQVNIPKALIPGGLLVNVCSYPSAGNGGNNNPFDCIVTPGAGFLVIVKNAGNDTTTSFPFAVEPVPAGVPSTYTIVGSGSNPPIGVVAGTNVETVTETVPTGWSLSNASCKLADGTTSTGTFDNANHKVTGITIQSGLATTCTFTNVLQPVTLTVIKNVVNDNGGTATASAFTMNVTGGTPGSFPGAASPGTAVSIQPNAPYSVTETRPSGYTQTNATDGCSSLTGIPPGGSGTCTITNDDVAPQLTVIKHVVNDDGGTAVAGDFTLDSGGSNDTPDNFPGAEAPGRTVTLDQGAYNVTETGPAGYAATFSADCSGSITVGQTKTCTVSNNDIAAKLVVIKHVINDNGGTAVAGDFTMTVDDPGTNPAGFPGAEAPGTQVAVDPGAYTVTEDGPAGYAASVSADCTGTLAIGQVKTCTVTNNDIAPKLHLRKVLINNNGGEATLQDFTLTANGAGANDLSGTTPVDSDGTLQADTWTLSETTVPGYAASDWVCEGGNQAANQITVGIGGEATCTITNDDIVAKLIVIKHVINDNGGTAAAGDFTMTVDDPGENPAGFSGAEAPGTDVAVDPGSYTVSESGPAGYADSYSADCTGTITIGQTKTCTVTNDDIAPRLHLRKVIVNDNGGTATLQDFTLTANGAGENDLSGTSPVDSGGTLQADTWTLSETTVPGYAAGDWVCEGGTQVANTIAVGIGGEATCTITNNDIAAKLIVIKHVINDNIGKAVAGDFTMTVDDPGTNPAGFPGAEAPGTQVEVDPGAYTVSETGVVGYASSYSADCTGTLTIGQVKTCTVTNNDVPPPAIDLSITKKGPASSVLVGANFNYTLTVRNAGPDTATNVTVEDPIPAGTKFVSVRSSQGSCTGGQVIRCSLGELARDAQAVITVGVKAMKTGNQVNTATVTGMETDTNPSNNRATEETLVRSVLQPPQVCPIMTVRPRSLPVGRKTTVRVAVGLQGRGVKGVRILIKGAGIRKTGVTNRYGNVRIAVRPRTAGVIVVRMVNEPKKCATRRIGAVGVFQPPFTG